MSIDSSTGPQRSFMEQKCREMVVQAFESGAVRELFPEDGRYRFIKKTTEIYLQPMIDRLLESGRTQTANCSDPFNLRDRAAVKVRFNGAGSIECLFYRSVGEGTSKNIYGVIPSSEGYLLAYAKDKELHQLRQTLQQLEGMLFQIPWKDLEKRITETEEKISSVEQRVREEVAMASVAPGAFPSRVVFKKDGRIKGFVTEYVRENLRSHVMGLRDEKPYPLRQLVELAAKTCEAIDALHQKNILHGDVKASNFLLKETSEGIVVSPCDFGSSLSIPSEWVATYCESTFPSPEALRASELLPVQFNLSMDLWSLGMTILEIVYGDGVTHPLKDWLQANTMDWKVVEETFLRGIPVRFFEVERVVKNLMNVSPQDRMSASSAAKELRRILTSPQRGAPDDVKVAK